MFIPSTSQPLDLTLTCQTAAFHTRSWRAGCSSGWWLYSQTPPHPPHQQAGDCRLPSAPCRPLAKETSPHG